MLETVLTTGFLSCVIFAGGPGCVAVGTIRQVGRQVSTCLDPLFYIYFFVCCRGCMTGTVSCISHYGYH